jgi:hypothetical protein
MFLGFRSPPLPKSRAIRLVIEDQPPRIQYDTESDENETSEDAEHSFKTIETRSVSSEQKRDLGDQEYD